MGSKKQCMRCMEFYDQRFDICPYCGYEENSERKELLHIDAGTVLADRYLVGNALGFGGFGVTYIGYDRKLKRKVAIKEYLPSEFATRALHQPEVMVNSSEKKMQQFAAGMNKFLDEAKKLATLSSLDGIVHIYDSFEANHTAYIVMEYLEGETLTAFMKREKKIPEEQAVDIVVPILQTLEDVHRHGIIHRDIAPDNIFLAKGQDGKTHVKLIDFGASRYASTSHSKSLTVLIKPGYSPAEQYQSNGEQGPFTDVYAVGAVLYQLVTGVRPEDAFERRTQIQSGGKDPLKDPSCYNGDLSESFENALMNAMSVRVEDRSETAEIFLRELTSQEPVKRRVSSIRRIDFMRWPLWAKIGVPTSAVAVITLIVLLAAGVIGFKGAVGIYKLPEGMTRVPDMINASMDDAQTWLDEAGLQVTQAGTVYTPGLAENVVLAQDISAGSVVMKNTMLSLTVSTGKEIYQMPDLTGMTEEYAKRALECMGAMVTTQDGGRNGLSPGCIVSQSIEPYAEIGTGDTVVLTVSRENGGAAGTVPQLTGMGYDEALNAAAAAGLTLTVTHKEFTHDCSTPTIKSQAVQAGGKAGADGVVGVEVLLPWHSFQMPNLNYRTEQDASQILANMGVQANVSQESSDLIAAGLVFAQGRAKGEALEPGTAVKITVSKGGKPFAMPGVVGLDESRARAVLAEMGLAVEIEYDFDAGVKEGNVISQSVSANTDVTRGTTVKIVVCSKKDLITVASVVGMDQGTAESAIKGQGLKVTINLIESSDSQKGLVISQLPEAGSSQKAGTTIVLTVGKGAPKKADPKPSNPTPTPTPDPTPDPTPVKKDPGPWSDWSTSAPPAGDYDVEQKNQYRYRDKETTSSTTYPLSGWTLVDSSSYYTDWGGWSDWSTNAVSESDTRQVETRWIEPTYRTLYNYNRYNEYDYATAGRRGWNGPSVGWWGGHYCQYYEEYGWTTTPLQYTGSDSGYNIYGGTWYNEWTSQEQVTAGRTEYRYRDRSLVTTYYYERWGSWTGWVDYAVSGSSSRQVETRTVYRYRTKGS